MSGGVEAASPDAGKLRHMHIFHPLEGVVYQWEGSFFRMWICLAPIET